MNRRSCTRAAALLLATGLSLAAGRVAAAQMPERSDAGLVGTWQGTLAPSPGARLRVAIEIVRTTDGGMRGLLTAFDPSLWQLPGRVDVEGDSVVIAIASANIRYAAVLSSAGDSLRGTYTQGRTMPLVMARVDSLEGMHRPQHPRPPFPYRSVDVAVPSVEGGQLAGTLTLPRGAGPFPAVVLISGSGPQDRDGSLFGHKPFLVIADHLARNGIATLRVDDRGVGLSSGNPIGATSADLSHDAEAAFRFLRTQPGIARDRVGFIGHSEGGMIAPMVAARNPDVAFLVLLAGPGVRGDSLMALQNRALVTSTIADSMLAARTMRFNHRVYRAVAVGMDSVARESEFLAAAEEYFSALPEAQQTQQVAARLLRAARQVTTPWFRFFLQYDPAHDLRRVRVPVLALNGTLDLQVLHEPNLRGIAAALTAGGNRQVRTMALPGLNHLFQTAKTGAVAEYATIEETFAPAVLELIAEWIGRVAG